MAHCSAKTGEGIDIVESVLVKHAPSGWTMPTILGDLIRPGDAVVLVVPVDKAAPKGRLILPQVMTIRDVIGNDAYSIVVKERELRHCLSTLNRRPALVVCDQGATFSSPGRARITPSPTPSGRCTSPAGCAGTLT